MIELVLGIASVVPFAWRAHVLLERRQPRRIIIELALAVVCLNFCSAIVTAHTIASERYAQWINLYVHGGTCEMNVPVAVHAECARAKVGLKRGFVASRMDVLYSDIGWVVAFTRVDVVAAFFALSNAHAGASVVALGASVVVGGVVMGITWIWMTARRKRARKTVQPALTLVDTPVKVGAPIKRGPLGFVSSQPGDATHRYTCAPVQVPAVDGAAPLKSIVCVPCSHDDPTDSETDD